MSNESTGTQYQVMTQTPVPRLIIKLAIPTTISMLVTNIYNLADTAFVGQLGTSQSGAVGIVFGLMAIIQAFAYMFGQGAGSISARCLGQKDLHSAEKFASTAFFCSIAVGLIIEVFGLIFIEPLIRMLGSTDTIMPYAKQYILYILLSAPFMSASFVMNNLLRYQGRASIAMIGLLAGALINIGLDPVLMFVLGMGISGAGLATASSQLVSFLILLYMFLSGKSQIKLSIKKVTHSLKDIGNIAATGCPSLARQGLSSLSTMLLNTQASVYGDAAVAAMSIVSRISMFIFSVGLGIGQGYQPMCAFNYGAKKFSRVKKGFTFSVLFSEATLLLLASAAFIFSPRLVALFRDDADVIAIGSLALRLRCATQPLLPPTATSEMMMQSSGRRVSALIMALSRNGVFFIPSLLIMAKVWGLFGIQSAQMAADILTMILIIPFTIHYFRTLPEDAPD